MPDTQTQAPDSSPDIASLAGGSGSPFDGLDYKKSIADLTDLKRKQVKEETDVMGKTDSESDRMLHNAEYYFKQEGVGPDNVPKAWDANKEHEKFEHNPIEGLGSVGGIFAVIASAFTKAPMENAINGMAGAINSIKAGDEAAYTRAYDSYKENTKLALERQKIQHEQYQDAISLWKTNMEAGNAKLRNLAVKYGDQQSLLLLDHGMDKELIEMMGARAKSADQIAQYNDSTTERTLRDAAYKAGVAGLPKTGNPQVDAAHKLALFTRTHGAEKETPQQSLMGQYFLEHPEATAEEAATFADKHGIIRQYGTAGGGATLTNDRTINKDADAHKARMREEHPDWDEDRLTAERDAYVKNRKIATSAPSGNKLDELTGKVDRIDNMDHTIDKVEDLLKKHNAITGLGGTITRPAEAISNVFGSNATDRKEFERLVSELQEWAPNALNDRNGRPLSSEASKIQTIIAGLKLGDTTANTARAYAELRPLLKAIKKQLQERKTGGASSAAPAAETEKTGADAPWLNDPVKP